MLKSEVIRRLQTKNTDLLELQTYEQEARSTRAVAEQHVLTLEPDLTQFDADIARAQECIQNLNGEIRDWKQKIKACEKWRFEAQKGKKEMASLQAAISAAAQDPYRTSEAEEERLFELGSQGYGEPQSRDRPIREAKIKIEDCKDIIKSFQQKLAELQAKKRELQGQYKKAEAEASRARQNHQAAKAKADKVRAEIVALNAKLGIIPTAEEEALAEKGPIKRFL